MSRIKNQTNRSNRSISRRGALVSVGAAAAALATIAVPGRSEEKAKGQRIFEGESAEGKFQDALDKAFGALDKAVRERGPDALGSWKLAEVTGQRIGLAGLHNLKVKLVATCMPPWDKK